MDLENEKWKFIDNFLDYQVSNYGRIKSFKFNKIKILKQILNGKYLTIHLCQNGKQETKKVHILVFETFNDYKLKENECVHHKDENEKNNYFENLIMMTFSDHISLHHKNMTHSDSTKQLIRKKLTGKKHTEETKKLMSQKRKGCNHPWYGKKHSDQTKRLIREKVLMNLNSILKEQDIIQIREYLNEGILTQKEIGKIFGVSYQTISKIKNRKLWNHVK